MSERLELPFQWLDVLWLQVTGTVCNIACRHCFISCGPKVRTHDLMTVEQIQDALDTAVAQGLREVWFTGGEPFVHPDILEIIDRTLAVAPLGILTNGMLIDEDLASELAKRARQAPYNFELRVSLDGCNAERNDAIRGRGVFEKTTAGIARLAAAGFDPLIAVSLVEADTEQQREAFVALMRELGVQKPRLKWIPPFKIGREARRGGGYGVLDRLNAGHLTDPEAPLRLQCGTSRTVTAEGVWPCPILINEPSFRMGDALEQCLGPNPVDNPACLTCWEEGFSCSA